MNLLPIRPGRTLRGVAICRPLAAAALLLALVLPLAPPASAAGTPQMGDFFEYHFHRHVGSGGGEYEGYADDTISDGRYEVVGTTGAEVTMHTNYRWSYTSNDPSTAPRDGGTENRLISFSLADRRYTSSQTDYDELDGTPASNYAVWFWIPPTVTVGQTFLVLDNTLRVVDTAATIWVGMTPYKAIKLEGTGNGNRNDNYGIFSFSFTDTYYFDIATGWVIAERYTERDTGTWRGLYSTFVWTEEIDFVRGSYQPAVDGGALAVMWGTVLGFLALLGLAAYAYRQRPRTMYVEGMARVRVGKLKEPARFHALLPSAAHGIDVQTSGAPLVVQGVTEVFGHFLDDFVKKAHASGDRMAYATSGGKVVGLGLYNEEGDVGAIFAKNTGVAEGLRRVVKAKDFFTEWRHTVPSESREWAAYAGVSITSQDSYNLLDTYEVLRLDRFPATGYDASLVTRMKPSDLRDVTEIAESVFKVPSAKWLKTQVGAGDIGFVARVEGHIVGFGLCTAVGHAGRIHTLAVLPEFRGLGIGRELVRARLAALEALGVRYVIAEVARWNLASLQLLYSHGFKKGGDLFVETARTARPSRKVVRR